MLIDRPLGVPPGLASVDWSDLPLALEDVERIEVFRGPNTVSYGANALMGVINIITAPRRVARHRLKYTAGQRGIRDWYASKHRPGRQRLPPVAVRPGRRRIRPRPRRSRPARRPPLSCLSTSTPATAWRRTRAWVATGGQEGSNQRPSLAYRSPFPQVPDDIDNSDTLAHDYAGSLRWNVDLDPRHSFYIQGYAQHWERRQEWNACEAAIAFSPQLAQLWELNPDYLRRFADDPTGCRPAAPGGCNWRPRSSTSYATADCARSADGSTVTRRESRYDLEMQDTLSLGDNLRLLNGLSYRYDQANSRTFYGGRGQQPDLAAVQPTGGMPANTGCCRAGGCSRTSRAPAVRSARGWR